MTEAAKPPHCQSDQGTRRYRTRGHVEEEIYILGATLLESPRGPLCNQRDARDEESLREPGRLLGRVKTKDTPEARHDQQRMNERDGLHPEQYQGSASYALTK